MSDTLRPHGPGQNMEWIAFPFSRGSSQPRDQTQVSRIAGGFFTRRATRDAHLQEVGSLSHSFLCTEDSAVDKNNRRGTLLDWIPKCESNGFSSLLDLPDPLLLLPLTAPPTLPPAADSLRLTRCSVHLVFLEAHVPEPSYQLQTEWLSSAPRAPMSSLSLSDPLFLGTHVALWFGSSLGPPVLSQ